MLWVQGFGNIAVELRSNFGWSVTLFSAAFTGTRVGAAILGPGIGVAIGKFGTKKILRFGAAIILVGFLGMSQIQTQWHFVLALSVAALGTGFAGFITITSALCLLYTSPSPRDS